MKRPFLNIFIPFAAGITAGYFLTVPVWLTITLSAFFAALFFLFSRRRISSHLALYAAVFLFGMAAYQHSIILPADHVAYLTPEKPEKVILRGIVVDDPVIETTFYHKEKRTFTLSVRAYKKGVSWKEARGLVKVDQYLNKPVDIKYGDDVTTEGLLYRPVSLKNPGLFDYSKYLAIRDIYSILKVRENFPVIVNGRAAAGGVHAAAYRIRNGIRSMIDRYMAYPYAGFVKAIIIGDRSALPGDMTEDFIKTGTVHIIAISGLNLGIIAAIILAVLGIFRIPKRVNLALTLTAIGVYSITAGASPPVIRAAIVFAVYVIGYLIRRDAEILNSLAIAGLIILLANPRELFDPSFQLSFASVACIIIFTPYIEKIFHIDRIGRRKLSGRILYYVGTCAAVSISAWAGTWPIVAVYFNIISPVSLAANLVIVPALFVLTIASFAFIYASFFFGYAAAILSEATQGISGAVFFINHLFAKIPYAYFKIGSPRAWFLILYYVLIASFVMPKIVYLRHIRIRKNIVIAAVLFSMNIFAWRDAMSLAGGKTCVTFLDVGQGDSALIELPSGAAVLVDGGAGGSEDKFDMGKNVIAPYLWNKGIGRLDAVVVTHFHDDHLGGILYLLENFKIGAVIDNGANAPGNAAYDRYIKILKKRDIRRIKVREGDIFTVGDARFFVLNPEAGKDIPDSNDDSIVMKLASGDMDIIFCGDVQEKSIQRLLAYGNFLHSEIIKVPHHGSSLGSEVSVRNFFEIVAPEKAVISVARINRYNAPSKAVLNAITSLNIKSYETKDGGAVIVCEK